MFLKHCNVYFSIAQKADTLLRKLSEANYQRGSVKKHIYQGKIEVVDFVLKNETFQCF